MKNLRKMKNEKGSITLYVSISMMFFVIVLMGIYVSTSSKMQKQNKEIEKIQKSYEQENIDDVYEKSLKPKLLSEVVNVGDYVKYMPDVVSNSSTEYTELISELGMYSGSSNNTSSTLTQEMGLNWRVLDVQQDGKVRLISELPTTSTIELSGYNGYNNAVFLLDKICNILYNNSKYTTKVQNLKIEDIQKYMNVTDYSTINSNYGQIITPTTLYYPSILEQEKDQIVNGNTGQLGLSEQSSLINQKEENIAISLSVKYTYWNKAIIDTDFKNQKYNELFIKNENNYSTYWLSSRCIYAISDGAGCCVRFVGTGSVNGFTLYSSNKYSDDNSYSIRPVITLNANVQIDRTDSTKDGSSTENAYILK